VESTSGSNHAAISAQTTIAGGKINNFNGAL